MKVHLPKFVSVNFFLPILIYSDSFLSPYVVLSMLATGIGSGTFATSHIRKSSLNNVLMEPLNPTSLPHFIYALDEHADVHFNVRHLWTKHLNCPQFFHCTCWRSPEHWNTRKLNSIENSIWDQTCPQANSTGIIMYKRHPACFCQNNHNFKGPHPERLLWKIILRQTSRSCLPGFSQVLSGCLQNEDGWNETFSFASVPRDPRSCGVLSNSTSERSSPRRLCIDEAV